MFIAVTTFKLVAVLDAVTLNRLSIFKYSSYSIIPLPLLGFSSDSRCLTLYTGKEFISWDLQTGGPLGTIPSGLGHRDTKPFSFTHSKDGKVVAVAYKSRDLDDIDGKYDTFIYTYDLLSGERVGSRLVPEGRMIYPIWTHVEYLQFATINPKSIKIWQSTFTLEHPPVEVASLPVPNWITNANHFLFLPSLSRLAFTLRYTVQVWDVKDSKLLLKSELALDRWGAWASREDDFPCGSFSSDSRFFAYTNTVGEVYVWEESPTGYLLRQRLPFFTSSSFPRPRLSPNSESIIAPLNSKIHQWHTRDQVLSLPSVPTRGSGGRGNFTLGFSLNENFAAFARRRDNTVTIIDLQSGELKWNIDMGVEIDCLGVTGGTVIVVGEGSIVTWNLPGGDRTTSINDVALTTTPDHSSPPYDLGTPWYMSISPDLSRIVVARGWPLSLEVDDVSTGSCLARITTHETLRPLFTRDGCEVWAWDDIHSETWEQCEITENGESGTIELKLQTIPRPPHGFFRESPCGYTITDAGWVLSPSQKRLLWLPHRWRSDGLRRAWDGQFLGLLDGELSEVVVLEFLG